MNQSSSMKRSIKSFFILFNIIFLTLLAGCATVPQPLPTGAVELKELCERLNIQWMWDSVSQVVTLRKGDREARAMVGSAVVIVEGDKIALSAAVTRTQNMIVVPPDFETLVAARLDQRSAVGFARSPVIIIDAGHGGKDPGAIGRSGVREKDVVLDIARRLQQALQGRGLDVKMTRSADQFISLGKRTEFATRNKADLFVSVHANSSPARNVQGIEVYTVRDLDYREKKEDQRRRNHAIYFQQSAMEPGNAQVQKVVADMLYNHKQRESPVLSSYVMRDLTQTTKAANRGRRKAGFFVLRNTLIPAVLVEVGFLSNKTEEKQLDTDAYRQQIADGLAESVYKYVTR